MVEGACGHNRIISLCKRLVLFRCGAPYAGMGVVKFAGA